MPLMDFVVIVLAVAFLLHITGVNGHPRIQAGLAGVYSSAALLVGSAVGGARLALYALATGFVAILLAQFAGWAAGLNSSQPSGVSRLRTRVPRL